MSDPVVLRDAEEVALARGVVVALAASPAGLRMGAIRTALGLPSRARRICDVVRALYAAGIIDVPAGPMRWRLVRRPDPRELQAAPRKTATGQPSVLRRVLAEVDLDERRSLRIEQREKDGSVFIAVRVFYEGRPGRHAIFLRTDDLAAVAEAFNDAKQAKRKEKAWEP